MATKKSAGFTAHANSASASKQFLSQRNWGYHPILVVSPVLLDSNQVVDLFHSFSLRGDINLTTTELEMALSLVDGLDLTRREVRHVAWYAIFSAAEAGDG